MADNQTRYAKLVNGQPRYAGDATPTATGFIVRPTEAQLRANGWLPVVDEPPTTDATHYARPTGWAVQDGAIRRQYEVVEIPPPPPRRWSRLSIKTALAVAGKLPAAEAFLSSVEVAPDYSAWQALTDCDYVEEGYGGPENWNAVLDGAATALGKTRSEIDAFLDAIPQEA